VNSSRIGIFQWPRVATAVLMFALASLCSADVVLSETGTLSSPEDTFILAINLPPAA